MRDGAFLFVPECYRESAYEMILNKTRNKKHAAGQGLPMLPVPASQPLTLEADLVTDTWQSAARRTRRDQAVRTTGPQGLLLT